MSKDWTGNKASTFATLGASNHVEHDRGAHDYYATDPIAVDMLAQTGFLDDKNTIWECACGGGHLAKRLKELGKEVIATDLYDYGLEGAKSGVDFLQIKDGEKCDAIITNPPYKYAQEFCEKATKLCPNVAMFLKLTFLEGAKRQPFFKANPPKYVAVCVNRVQCAINGDKEMFSKSSAACYAWFIWGGEHKGNPEILWINKKKVV